MELIVRREAEYVATWEWQRARARELAAGEAGEALLLVEHESVYTLGQRSDPAHLLGGEDGFRKSGAHVVWVDRGGDVTWHGPGQITGYPILDLKTRGRDLHRYVESLEQVVIDVCALYGVVAGRQPGLPGVWVGERKIASLGVKLSHNWIAYHGFALNVSSDLTWFARIVPCGLHGFEVTSLEAETGRQVEWSDAVARIAASFERAFAVSLTETPGVQSARVG
ncbi:MAG: lipoyl(octanoyl) transferase LipB [Chloroflexota bacterium]